MYHAIASWDPGTLLWSFSGTVIVLASCDFRVLSLWIFRVYVAMGPDESTGWSFSMTNVPDVSTGVDDSA